MKGLKWKFNNSPLKMSFVCALLVLFLAFLFSLLHSSPVEAYSFGDVGNFNFAHSANASQTGGSWVDAYYNPTDGRKRRYFVQIDTNGYNLSDVAIFNSSFNPAAGYLNEIWLKTTSIPAHSLFSFSIRYAGLSGGNLRYNGFTTYGDWTLLNDSCVQSASQTSNSNTYAVDFACTYYGYTENGFNADDFIKLTGYIVNFEQSGVMVVASGGSYVQVSADDGSTVILDDISDDIGDILGEIRNNNTQNSYIYIRMADMMELLEDIQDGQLTAQNIEDAVANANVTTMEEEQEMLEEAAEAAETQANSSGAQSQAQGQSLVSIISAFVTAITSPTGGSCVIDLDLSLYQGGTHNNVDLCHLSPPSGVATVLSILLIIFVVRAVVHVIQAMIALYKEYQS